MKSVENGKRGADRLDWTRYGREACEVLEKPVKFSDVSKWRIPRIRWRSQIQELVEEPKIKIATRGDYSRTSSKQITKNVELWNPVGTLGGKTGGQGGEIGVE